MVLVVATKLPTVSGVARSFSVGVLRGGGSGKPARKAHWMPQGRQGAWNRGWGVEDFPPSLTTTWLFLCLRGGGPLYVGRCGPDCPHPC